MKRESRSLIKIDRKRGLEVRKREREKSKSKRSQMQWGEREEEIKGNLRLSPSEETFFFLITHRKLPKVNLSVAQLHWTIYELS